MQRKLEGFLGGGIFYLSNAEIENLKSDFLDVHDKYVKKSQMNRAKKGKNRMIYLTIRYLPQCLCTLLIHYLDKLKSWIIKIKKTFLKQILFDSVLQTSILEFFYHSL